MWLKAMLETSSIMHEVPHVLFHDSVSYIFFHVGYRMLGERGII